MKSKVEKGVTEGQQAIEDAIEGMPATSKTKRKKNKNLKTATKKNVTAPDETVNNN